MALGLGRPQLAERSKGGPHFLSATTIKRLERGESVYASTAGSYAALVGKPLRELLEDSELDGETAHRPALAVFPFRALGDESTPFVEGLAEDLITRLNRWWFPVIARTSTLGSETADPARTARQLDARYWVDGSVQRADGVLRVTAQLVDAESGAIVARHAYDGRFQTVFAAQDELTAAIVSDLGSRLVDAETARFAGCDPSDLDAWQQALLGAWHFYRRTADDNARARTLLQQALKRDPDMPIAWYALALTYQQDVVNQWCSDSRGSIAELGAVCTEFERRYPEEAWSRVASAYLDVYAGRRDAAMSRLREAIDRDPNTCQAYALYGQTLAMAKDPDRALEQFEVALRLSPRDTERWAIHTGIALAHFVAERYEQTVAAAREASYVRPGIAFPYGAMASAHALLGNLAEARDAIANMFRVAPNTTLNGIVAIMGSTEKEIGKRYLEGLQRAGLQS